MVFFDRDDRRRCNATNFHAVDAHPPLAISILIAARGRVRIPLVITAPQLPGYVSCNLRQFRFFRCRVFLCHHEIPLFLFFHWICRMLFANSIRQIFRWSLLNALAPGTCARQLSASHFRIGRGNFGLAKAMRPKKSDYA